MTELSEAAGTAVIHLAGEIDHDNAATITDQVAQALELQPVTVTIDMAAVDFLGSSALSAMVAARTLCIAAGAGLQLANPSKPVLRLLAITGLDRLFGTGYTD